MTPLVSMYHLGVNCWTKTENHQLKSAEFFKRYQGYVIVPTRVYIVHTIVHHIRYIIDI